MKKVMLAAVVVALVGAAPAPAYITAIYPKKVCFKTSHSKIKNAGDVLRQKPVVYGAVAFGWCQRVGVKHHGDVISWNGPTTQVGRTRWGQRNGWEYDGISKRTVKCLGYHGGGYCSYVRVKVWHEFDKEIAGFSVGHHTMKFSLLVGNGQEVW